MSRQSGWSSVSKASNFATAANAVPLGSRHASNDDNSSSSASPSRGSVSAFSVADKLREAAGLSFQATFLSPAPLDQASKHARKIYIGNLPPSVTQETVIAQFFNQTLAALLPNKPPGDSIVGTYLNVAKRFAFIENRSIEETTFTLSLDGIVMDRYALKLRRPQDYNPRIAQQQLAVEMQLKGGISSLRGAANISAAQLGEAFNTATAPGIVSTSVEDGPNKVFIGGLPHHMSEGEVKELLASFGALKAFHLVKDRETDRSKGFAFCEWRDPSLTDVACNQLNGMKVGDRFLNVRRAIGHQQHRIAGSSLPALTGGPSGMGGADVSLSRMGQPLALTCDNPIGGDSSSVPASSQTKIVHDLKLPEVAKWLKKESTHASRCLAVKRIVPADQELDVTVIVNLFGAVKKAAGEIGKVRNAIFHHSGGGQILIEFSSPEEAAAAQKALDGEKLSDVTLHCSLVEMIPEMRKGRGNVYVRLTCFVAACLKRLMNESDRLARMDPEARLLYQQQEKKLRERCKVFSSA